MSKAHASCLRRTAVRNMVRGGVPERVAMQLTGHKTRSVFERHNIGSGGGLRTAAEQLRGLTGRGTERDNRGTRGIHAQPKARDCLAKVEAPSGFEPEMEVLQTGPTISMLLARFAFWLVLTCVLLGVRWVLFPSCSQRISGICA